MSAPTSHNTAHKTVDETAVRDQVYMVFPNDLNAHGTVFGGLVMAQMDRLAAVVANRHAGCTCVTVSVDAVHFLAPAERGDTLVFCASVNRAWRSSMEIGVRVEAETLGLTTKKHIVSAYFTFVAVDADKKPTAVLPVLPENPEQKARYEEAELRRNSRLDHAEKLKKLRAATPSPAA